MEFRFDLHPIFNQPIIKVNSNLLPIGFRGDRRLALDTATKIAEVINEMGEASARAQGLSNPVTTAQKLRMTDQNVYLLGDPSQGRNGAVVGLLKVGKKSLYVFDPNGQTQMVNAPCVLDFYIHESRQRSGLGRDLFETMLKQEEFHPKKLAVDRPSDKLLGFLRKHYGLQKTIPQMNNFVVYDGFFDKPASLENVNNQDNRMHLTASPNTALFGPQFINDEQAKRSKAQLNASNTSIPLIQSSPVGRYAAPRPMCSMAEVLSSSQLDSNTSKPSPSGTNLNRPTPSKGSVHTNNNVNSGLTRQSSNAVMNNTNLQPSNIPVPIASSTSVNRNFGGNNGIHKTVPSNTNVIRERAAGIPSQNYAQHGDTQSVTHEATMPQQPEVLVDVNPAEPIEKTNIPVQENKAPPEQIASSIENSNEVFHEVCPNCSTKFPSTRNSTVKIGQSNTMIQDPPVNVSNNQTIEPIIHNTATPATGEPNSSFQQQPSAIEPFHQVIDDTIDTININIENFQISVQEDNPDEKEFENMIHQQDEQQIETLQQPQELTNGHRKEREVKINPVEHYIEQDEVVEPIIEPRHIQKPTSFPLSKQHTGLKNISYNVSLAVSPTNKMEFIPKQSETMQQNRSTIVDKPAGLPSHDSNDAASTTSSTGSGGNSGAGLTDQGYFDLKFYHNKLW